MNPRHLLSSEVKGPEQIESTRLRLRRPVPSDIPDIFTRYAGDPVATRFLSWRTHRSLEDTQRFLDWSDAQWARWPAGPYLVFARTDGALLGSTGLACESEDKAATGYVLAPDAWGQGYATETLLSMLDLARSLHLRTLEAACYIDHPASAHVLEKCGFYLVQIARESTEFPNLAPGRKCDVHVYQFNF